MGDMVLQTIRRLDSPISIISRQATTPPPADFENVNESSTLSEWISYQIIESLPNYSDTVISFINENQLKNMFKMLSPMPDYVIQTSNEEHAISVTRAMFPCPHHMNTYNVRGDFSLDEAYRLLYKKTRALLVVFKITEIDCEVVRPWSRLILHILSESEYITNRLLEVYPSVMSELKKDFPDMQQVDTLITTIPSDMNSLLIKKIFAGFV